MSTISESPNLQILKKKKRPNDSTSESRPSVRRIAGLLFLAVAGAFALYNVFLGGGGRSVATVPAVAAAAAPVVSEPPQVTQQAACSDTVIERVVEVPGPERIVEVPGPIEYVRDVIEVPGPEVEKIVLVPQVEVQRVDLHDPGDALDRGVRICVYGHGFTGIFVDDFGIIGGGCRDFPSSVYDSSPVETHTVRVTR